MKRIIPLLAMLWLTGCIQTPEQMEALRLEQEQRDNNTCASYGLRPGSEAFGNCRLQLDLAREQRQYYYNAPYPRFYGGYYHYVR